MNSSVKVSANEAGKVVNVSENNPAYGFIRVTQDRLITDDSGWLRVKTLSALIPGLVSDLNKLGWVDGQEIEGKIIIKEKLEPFNKKNPEKDLKIAGDTGIVCKIGGKSIYRNTMYTTSATAQDITINHDNVEEIRGAYGTSVVESFSVADDEDFSL